MKQATVLLPDISGYTRFMTRTELHHGTHIINELLKVIADSVEPNFTLAEIEGDALLTYAVQRFSQASLVNLCLDTFHNFHGHLELIERNGRCHCGACQGASQLKLKFIVHYGEFDEVKVGPFTKLSGLDMIVAHRLMKNSIPHDEYLLATTAYSDGDLPLEPQSLDWNPGADVYEFLGEIRYCFADLGHLRQ